MAMHDILNPTVENKNAHTPHVILLSLQTRELLLIINLLIFCNNNKDYVSLGIGMCIFLKCI